MKILVCIKQVPDLDTRFVPNSRETWFEEAGLAFRMNDYDEFAVEEAIRLKEQLGGNAEVTVLSVGPDRIVEMLRKALAMGCDYAVHIRDIDAAERDPWQIASMISGYASRESFEIIFTGMQSTDRGSAQVGVLIAEQLGMACATTIVGFSFDGDRVTVDRELEGGARAVVACKLPALLTCQLGLNTPRYPTLPNIMKSKKKEITVHTPESVGLETALVLVSGFAQHERSSGGMVLEGSVSELADRVVAELQEKTAVLRRGGAR